MDVENIFDGESVEQLDTKGWTPLIAAANQGDYSKVVALLKAGADVRARCVVEGRSALMHAVRKGDIKSVAALVAAGSDLEHIDNSGQTPLLLAAAFAQYASMIELLKHGADVNATCGLHSVLHLLAEHRDYGTDTMIRLMCSNGTDVNFKHGRFSTALIDAAAEGIHANVVALLECGANPDLTNPAGMTAEEVAALNGYVEVLRVLQAARAAAQIRGSITPKDSASVYSEQIETRSPREKNRRRPDVM